MLNKSLVSLLRSLSLFCVFLVLSVSLINVDAFKDHHEDASQVASMVKRGDRKSVVETEYGEISQVRISDGTRGPYFLQFITLEPSSLFLPVLLRAGMVFYVHTGSGRLSWTDEKDTKSLNIKRGDVYRLQPGSIFFIESDLEPEREKLRIHAVFSSTDEESFDPEIGAYTSIGDLVLGFDDKVLQSAFKVSEDLIEALRNTTRPPPIIHALPREKESTFWELESRFLKAIVGDRGFNMHAMNGKRKKTRTYNVFDVDPDFSNCNGWSLTVDRKDLKLLKESNIGIFMVNLTKGSMMGPHWNPMAMEIAVVLHGQGMIRVVCPSSAKKSSCKNVRFRAEEGDVFVVPRFHPMAQMSFNNDSFVFMGFSATRRRNYPQFLAGKSSVIQTLDNRILAVSFNVSNTTIDHLLAQQAESVILDCTSCAEEEESIMKEEIKREKEEEGAKKREEEEKKRKEEEEKRAEEARKREEKKKREEEEEERERREREEEEAKKREEEEERESREREEEEAKKKEEEEERERREREEEEAKKREEEERESRERQEEEAKKREEEERERRERQEEEAKKREEEEEERERREREEAEAKKREKEEEERERREREEQRKIEKEEEERRRQKEKERQEEEEEEEEGEERRKREAAAKEEEEEARRQEEERQRREEQEEEPWRREQDTEGGHRQRRVLKHVSLAGYIPVP